MIPTEIAILIARYSCSIVWFKSISIALNIPIERKYIYSRYYHAESVPHVTILDQCNPSELNTTDIIIDWKLSDTNYRPQYPACISITNDFVDINYIQPSHLSFVIETIVFYVWNKRSPDLPLQVNSNGLKMWGVWTSGNRPEIMPHRMIF